MYYCIYIYNIILDNKTGFQTGPLGIPSWRNSILRGHRSCPLHWLSIWRFQVIPRATRPQETHDSHPPCSQNFLHENCIKQYSRLNKLHSLLKATFLSVPKSANPQNTH